jgi:hypothetical protein
MDLVYDHQIVNLQTNTNLTFGIEVYQPIIDELIIINPDVVVVGGYTYVIEFMFPHLDIYQCTILQVTSNQVFQNKLSYV